MRSSYWSSSKFAKWIERRFGKFETPFALEWHEWDEWRTKIKAEAPKTYWVTHVAFDSIQKFVMWPADKLNDIRYYVKNRYFDKLHYLPTGLEPGRYYDLDTRLLNATFGALVDFVEIEKAHMQIVFSDEKKPWRYRIPLMRFASYRSREHGLKHLAWESGLDDPNLLPHERSDHQAETSRIVRDLYLWWKDERPNRPDPHATSGWFDLVENTGFGTMLSTSKLTPAQRKVIDDSRKSSQEIERAYDQEDEDNLIKLIKIRKSLWT